MHDGNDEDVIRLFGIKNGIRKNAGQAAPYVIFQYFELPG
jgi:hypothetical protein